MAKIKQFPFYPAHSSNYTKGREGRSIKYFTVHHTAGFEASLKALWQNPDRNGSSHFFAGDTHSEQYVDTDDTAWTNNNWLSNTESITCETRGDWRNGYRDGTTLGQLKEIMYQCLKLYPNLSLNYHRDVSRTYTVCPADLKDKGYALEQWNAAKNRIKVENEANNPSTPVKLRVDIPDKKVILIRDANLWDMSFTSFANAKAIKALPAGTVIDVAGVYDHPLSKTDYYLSKYSWDHGQNYGISKADCKDYVEPTPAPKPPTSNPGPTPPPHEETGAGTLPPLPVDPAGKPLDPETVGVLTMIATKLGEIIKAITDFIARRNK